MRKLIYAALMASAAVQSHFGSRIYQWGSLGQGGIPAIPDFMYLLVMESNTTSNRVVRRTNPSSSNKLFQFNAYDQHGQGYLQIQQGLFAVRDTLLMLEGQVSPEGVRCTEAVWTGLSPDSRDAEYVANMKYLTMRFVASE